MPCTRLGNGSGATHTRASSRTTGLRTADCTGHQRAVHGAAHPDAQHIDTGDDCISGAGPAPSLEESLCPGPQMAGLQVRVVANKT